MTQDKRAEIVEAMAEAMHRTDRPHDHEWKALLDQTRLAYRILASAALDIALKAAAETLQSIADAEHQKRRAAEDEDDFVTMITAPNRAEGIE